MPNYSVKNVDEFIAASPIEARPHLTKIRNIVEANLPSIEKEIGYGKPYYKYHGWVVGFDVYKKHIGFEVWDGYSNEARQELEQKGYKTGSVTFQIRYDQEVPEEIIAELVRIQARLNKSKATTN